MADKMNTINTPSGAVDIPAWASEETLNRVVAYMSAQNKTDRDLNKMMSKVGGNINELQKELAGLLKATVVDNEQDQKQEEASERFSEQLVKNTQGLMKTARFFGNSEKPLSAITDGASKLAAGSKDGSGSLKMFSGFMKSGSLWQNALGTAGNIAADALLAYAGWNAGKIEQFAEAQTKIIDAGVVFNGGAAAFDELRKNTLSTGVTYTALIDNIHQFGDGMLGLGGTMSAGVTNFSKFYSALDEQVENFGDLGLSSKDMMTQYGEFLVYARRTGMVNSNLNNSASKVNSSFIDLQIEAGAVASLTSLTKQEAMRRTLQSFDEFGEAALISLEQQGLTGAADTTRAIISNLGKMAPGDEHMKLILDAVQQEAFEKSTNMAAFDISGRLQQALAGSENSIDNVYSGFIDNIENMMRAGDMSANDVSEYIFGAIKNADLDKYATFSAAADTVAGQTQQIQANAVKNILIFGNLADPGALDTAKTKLKTNLKEAGKVTLEMNQMTRRFLEVQETFTMDMETVAGMFNGVYELFGQASNKLTSLAALKEQETNDFGGIGADINDATIAVTGGVGTTPQYQNQADAVSPDDSEETAAAKIANQEVALLTAEDLAGFTQLFNPDNTLQKLNSLAPQARMRMLGVIKDFDEKYAGTETKMSVTSGMEYKTDAQAPDTWETTGNTANVLLMQGDSIIVNDDSNMYSEGLGSILAANNMSNETGQGVGVATVSESVDTSFSQFSEGPTGGIVTAQPKIEEPERRKHGGPVDSGKPYIVGDQMGLDTAELFVPNSSGTILSNTEILEALMPEMARASSMTEVKGYGNPEIKTRILEALKNNLTNPEISRKINNSEEITEIINSKRHTIEALVALRTIVKRLNNQYNLNIDIDMMNSR